MSFKIVRTSGMEPTPFEAEVIAQMGAEFISKRCTSEDEILGLARDADALLPGAYDPITKRVISGLKECKIIAAVGVGYDNIDVKTANELGIWVTNTPEYCLDEMSDHAMALLVTSARKTIRVNKEIKEKRSWQAGRAVLSPVFKLRGQTLGLFGLGRIPRRLVPKAQGFGMRVIAADPYVSPAMFQELNVEKVSFDTLLAESDFISVHAALTDETRHTFGLEQFKKMKPTAYIINTARGPLIDEAALVMALREGYIAGAGLDVVEGEPQPVLEGSPLLELDNVILTGHSGMYSEDSIVEIRKGSIQEIARVAKGEPPKNPVNPGVKERFAARWQG
ncbi:MAG: C-terminal binding protein [Chloroflexi bacterium]|nr:C-terminal binding protein [Chloroflexota bacterium]